METWLCLMVMLPPCKLKRRCRDTWHPELVRRRAAPVACACEENLTSEEKKEWATAKLFDCGTVGGYTLLTEIFN